MDFKLAITLQLVDNFLRQLTQINEATKQFDENIKKTQTRLEKFQETIKKAFDPKRIQEASEKIEDTVVKIAQAVALPAAGFSKIINDFKDMENARVSMEVAFMTNTGLPQEMQQINKTVEDLGNKLPGSAADFYKVATALKSTGLEAKDIANGILKGASYAWVLFKDEVNPEQAAEYMSQFANAFRIPSKDFMTFVDRLQRVRFASGLTLTEIAYSTKYFSAELNQLGFTGIKAFNFMGAWIGTLKQFGLQGETAGTSIRSVLQNIVNLDQNIQKLSKKNINLGISAKDFIDADGHFNLERFIMTMRDKLSKIKDPIQRMEVMKTLFDGEGMRAITPLLAKNKEEAIAYLDAIKNTLSPEEYQNLRKQIEQGGFTGLEEMAKKMEQQAALQERIDKLLGTFANTLESLQGTLSTFFANLGELIAPELNKLLNKINDFIGIMSDFVDKHKTAAKIIFLSAGAFVGFLVVLGAVGLVLASVMKLFAIAFSPFVWLSRTKLVRALTSAVIENSIAMLSWIKAKILAVNWGSILRNTLLFLRIAFFNIIAVIRAFTITLFTTPIGWFILGITAIVGVGYLLYRNWDRVVKWLSSAWNWLKENWKKLAQAILLTNPFTAVIITINNFVNKIFGINLFEAGKKILTTLAEGIQSVANKPVEVMKTIVQKIRNLLPFSPAKEGPLRDIHRIKLIETIAEGIKPEPIIDKMKQVAEKAKTISLTPIITNQATLPIKTSPSTKSMIVVNLGGITIGTAGQKEIDNLATELEKRIKSVMERIINDTNRRRY